MYFFAESLMHRLPRLIELLVSFPDYSNVRLAHLAECDPRRVRRYRALIAQAFAENKATPDDMRGCQSYVPSLNRFFNPRRRRPRHASPDYRRLREERPAADGRTLWRAYVEAQHAAGLPAMSYVHFMRRKRAA